MDGRSFWLSRGFPRYVSLPPPRPPRRPGGMVYLRTSFPSYLVDRHGGREEGSRSRSRPSFGLGPSPSVSTDELSSMHDIWKMLPEEILDKILSRFSLAAQGRFRCVCRKWNAVLSLPRLCTILSEMGNYNAGFYCNSANKWLQLPCSTPLSFEMKGYPPHWRAFLEMKWEVVDVDASLVCYKWESSLWVCNPLKMSSFLLLEHLEYPADLDIQRVKLLVDRVCKTFHIVLLLDVSKGLLQSGRNAPRTMVYDSTSARWQTYDSYPGFRSLELFASRNVIYAYNLQEECSRQESLLAAFVMESGSWINFKVTIPSECHIPTNRFFLSDKGQVLLILESNKNGPCLSVWKLLGINIGTRIAPNRPPPTWDKWEKILDVSNSVIVDLTSHSLIHACYGGRYICFGFRDDKKDTEEGPKTCKCVRYSFAGKIWETVPSPQVWGDHVNLHLYNWEPRLDVNPSLTEYSAGPVVP